MEFQGQTFFALWAHARRLLVLALAPLWFPISRSLAFAHLFTVTGVLQGLDLAAGVLFEVRRACGGIFLLLGGLGRRGRCDGEEGQENEEWWKEAHHYSRIKRKYT